MQCNYIQFSCNSFYDGTYELDAVLSSATQIYFHQIINNALLYFNDGGWILNHPNEYRWYTTEENIFGPTFSVNCYATDEIIPQFAIHVGCTGIDFYFL